MLFHTPRSLVGKSLADNIPCSHHSGGPVVTTAMSRPAQYPAPRTISAMKTAINSSFKKAFPRRPAHAFENPGDLWRFLSLRRSGLHVRWLTVDGGSARGGLALPAAVIARSVGHFSLQPAPVRASTSLLLRRR